MLYMDARVSRGTHAHIHMYTSSIKIAMHFNYFLVRIYQAMYIAKHINQVGIVWEII